MESAQILKETVLVKLVVARFEVPMVAKEMQEELLLRVIVFTDIVIVRPEYVDRTVVLSVQGAAEQWDEKTERHGRDG